MNRKASQERLRPAVAAGSRLISCEIATAAAINKNAGLGLAPNKRMEFLDAHVVAVGDKAGLAICRILMGRHDGRIAPLVGKEARGAAFEFALPAATLDPERTGLGFGCRFPVYANSERRRSGSGAQAR